VPDLLDFAVFCGISNQLLEIVDSDELSSDHSPIIINFNTEVPLSQTNKPIFTNKTNIKSFQNYINRNLNANITINTGIELEEAIESFTKLIHDAAFNSTPLVSNGRRNENKIHLSLEIRNLIQQKRRLRRIWKNNRNPLTKRDFNNAANYLKKKLQDFKNENTSAYLSNLKPNSDNEHNLWKATKYLKRPVKRNVPLKDNNNNWHRSDKKKAEAFSRHLEETFKPFDFNCNSDSAEILEFLDAPCQMDFPIRRNTIKEILSEIKTLNNKKTPGYDKIGPLAVKALPKKALKF